MRRLLWIVLLLSVALALLIGGYRTFNSAKSLRLVDVLIPSGYQTCKPPCWRGILPGRDSVEAARDRLLNDPEFMQQASELAFAAEPTQRFCGVLDTPSGKWRFCLRRQSSTNGPLQMIELYPDQPLVLGDTLILFGQPLTAQVCLRQDGSPTAELFFEQFVAVRARGYQYDPTAMKVSAVQYVYPSIDPIYPFDLPAWRGFQTPVDASPCY